MAGEEKERPLYRSFVLPVPPAKRNLVTHTVTLGAQSYPLDTPLHFHINQHDDNPSSEEACQPIKAPQMLAQGKKNIVPTQLGCQLKARAIPQAERAKRGDLDIM